MTHIRINRSTLAILNAMAVKLPDGSYTISDNHNFNEDAGTFRSIREFLNQTVEIQSQDGVERGALNMVVSGRQKTKVITDDYTITHDDAQLLVLTTTKDITITLPEIAEFPQDGLSRTTRIVKMNDGGFVVKVKPANGEEYVRGMSEYVVKEPGQFIQFIGVNSDTPQARKWITFPTDMQTLEVVNSGSLDGDNFNGGGAKVTFDTVEHSDNVAIMEHNGTTRLTAKVKGEYSINFWLSMNKSGVGAWSATASLYKSGVDLPVTEIRCNGAGSNSDASITLPLHVVDLEADEYIELHLTITGTGTDVISSGMSMRVRV
jgi:hypothetical protein